MSSKKHSILFIVTAIAALLVFTSVAYAGYVTIDTTNNQVDIEWSGVSMLVDDDNLDWPGSDYNIDKAWVGNNAADPSEVYFRVDLVDGPLPSGGDSLEARLDCSTPANDSYQDSEDILVYYFLGYSGPSSDDIAECQGNLAPDCTSASVEHNGVTFGEEVGTGPYTYEWKADISGITGWSDCLTGTINVQFATRNGTSEMDYTQWSEGGYSIPNVVTLKSFTAQNQVLPVAAIVLGVVAVGGLVVIRRRKGH